MNTRRVAITGIGALCGLGHNTQEIWKNALASQSGIRSIQLKEDEEFPISYAGHLNDFEVNDSIIDFKDKSRFDRFIHFALHATHEAFEQAKLDEADYLPHRKGCILGVGMGGFHTVESVHATFLEKGVRRVSPFFIPGIIPNMAPAKVAMKYQLQGPNFSTSSACASAGHAISTAATQIMLGLQDAIITGGCEAVVTSLTTAGFTVMRALSKNPEATKASRPFDQDRDGFVIGEGAGILILEDLEKAQARGANILAELVGFGSTCDAYHISAPHPEGLGAIQCMKEALQMAQIPPTQIDYINAHGTSTPRGDVVETISIKNVFQDHARALSISSSKSMTGHLLGAASGLESVFCIKALEEQVIPPTINLNTPDPECDLDYTPNQAKKRTVSYALNNSFGFGGTNSSLIFKKG